MKYPASHLNPFPPTFPGKITCKKILSAKNCARAPAIPLSTFKMNTCKSASKQRTLTPFRMNTCEKPGGGGRDTRDPASKIGIPNRHTQLAYDDVCIASLPWPLLASGTGHQPRLPRNPDRVF